MARWSSVGEAFALSVKNWRIWVLQFVGNAIIALALLWWLRLGEAHWWQLLLQLVLVVGSAVAICVLHGGTFNYLAAAHQDRAALLTPSFQRARKHLFAFAVWAAIFFVLWGWTGNLHEYDIRFPGYLRSEFPAWLRNIVSANALNNLYTAFVFFVRWVVLPGLLFPFALFTAQKGFSGLIAFRDWSRPLRSLGYWLTLLVAAILGVYCVEKIMNWTLDPRTATLGAEKTSLFFRTLFSYLLALFAWMLSCSMLGRVGSQEAVTQPK